MARRLVLAGSGLAALALIALGGRSLFFFPAPPPPDVKPSLAVLPFENASGDAALEPWVTALPDLVTVDLGQSRYVNVVKITNLLRALGPSRGLRPSSDLPMVPKSGHHVREGHRALH